MNQEKKLLNSHMQKRLVTESSAPGAFVVLGIVSTAILFAAVINLIGVTSAFACDYTCDSYGGDYYSYGNDYSYPIYGDGYSDYNYVQYPNLYYQYNQNPGPRNTMADYYNSASSLQYPYLQYQYTQNPRPRDPMADYYANSASTRYPYLQYQYAASPTARDPMADYYANAASASYPYSIYVPAGSNQASVLSKYNVGATYSNSSQYASGQNYGYGNPASYYGGQQGGGFILTSGY